MVLLNTLPEQLTTLFREALALHVLGYGRVTCVMVCMRTHCVYEPFGEGGSYTPYMYVGTLQHI